MPDAKAILSAIAALERVQAELARISARTDERRRHDLIDLRRNLSLQIAEVGRIAEPWFAADPQLAQTYRGKFSRMRSAAAMHQANWPAVRLDQADADYWQSVKTVREANHDFVAWMRVTVR